MTAPGHARVYPLTHRWHLALWRGGRGPGGLVVALGEYTKPCGTGAHWHRDFSSRFGLYTIAGWRTVRRVPVSAGWVYGGLDRIGFTVTVASRTLMFAQLATPADLRASRERHGDLHRKEFR